MYFKNNFSIKFYNTFKDFDKKNNIIRDILMNAFPQTEYSIAKKRNRLAVIGNYDIGWSDRSSSDFKKKLASTFFELKTKSSNFQVWWGNELLPMPHKKYNLYLYYTEVEKNKTIYFPGMYLTQGFFPNVNYNHDKNRVGKINFSKINFSKSRDLDLNDKKYFCCAFINNMTPERSQAIKRLSKIGKVDVYGTAGIGPVEHKFSIAKNYKFFLCMENDYHEGFLTEKVLEAWMCYSVPIWWGNDSNNLINKEAIIEIEQIEKDNHLDKILDLKNDYYKLHETIKKNILNQKPEVIYSNLINDIRRMIF